MEETELNDLIKNLEQLQKEDPEIQRMYEKIKDSPYLKMYNGILFQKVGNEPYRAVIPKSIQSKLIDLYHHKLGHFGASKCISALSERFFWKRMHRQARKILVTCDVCQKTKYPNKTYKGDYNPVICSRPHELVCADIFGPLPSGKYGYKYVFVIIDMFTRFVKLYPLRNITAKSCADKFLNCYCIEIGKPNKILTDNATMFHAKLWYNKLKENYIKSIHCTVRNPQGNASERVIRSLGRCFRLLVNEKHASWVSQLEKINEWLNSVVHSSTGFTPYELQYGQPPPRPLVDKIMFPEDVNSISHGQKLDKAYNNIKFVSERRKLTHTPSKPYKFQIGDRILVRVSHLSSAANKCIDKFFHLYERPFVMKEEVGPNAYLLINPENNMIIGKYNAYHLKSYKEPLM